MCGRELRDAKRTPRARRMSYVTVCSICSTPRRHSLEASVQGSATAHWNCDGTPHETRNAKRGTRGATRLGAAVLAKRARPLEVSANCGPTAKCARENGDARGREGRRPSVQASKRAPVRPENASSAVQKKRPPPPPLEFQIRHATRHLAATRQMQIQKPHPTACHDTHGTTRHGTA